MTNGFISVSEPLVYSKHQSFSVRNNQKQLLCVLKGCIKSCYDDQELMSGSVIRLENDMREVLDTKMMALEDSVVVMITSEGETALTAGIIEHILASTVDYIAESKDKLIKGTTSCRP